MIKLTRTSVLYGMAAIVALGFSVERLNAQDEAPLAASPSPPPDVQKHEKHGKPPVPPGKSPETAELLQMMKLSRVDIEQRKADKNQRQLPAADEEPPEVKERKKVDRAPDPTGLSPDVEELLDKVRNQPGGAVKLERARKAGAKIPPGKAGGATPEAGRERSPGPRMDGADFEFSSAEQQQPTLKATRNASAQSVAGFGSLSVADMFSYTSSTSGTMSASGVWGPLSHYGPGTHGAVGSLDVKPFLSVYLNVTSPGWYLINVVATKGNASLRKYGPGSGTPPLYPLLTRWENSSNSYVYVSYPHLVNLAAGGHYLYWIPDPGWFHVSEVSVTKF